MSQIKCDFDKFNSFRPKLSIFDIFKEIITIWAKLSAIFINSIVLGLNFQSLIFWGNYNDLSQIKWDFDKINSFMPKFSIFHVFNNLNKIKSDSGNTFDLFILLRQIASNHVKSRNFASNRVNWCTEWNFLS